MDFLERPEAAGRFGWVVVDPDRVIAYQPLDLVARNETPGFHKKEIETGAFRGFRYG